MRNLTKKIFLGLFLATVSLGFSQTKVTGTVIDSETNAPLPGANVSVKGGSVGTVTDFDGKFSLEAKTSKGELVISYVGFLTKTVAFSGAGNVGNISLTPDASQLDEVVVVGSGLLDLAKDRKTPVAVSTIKAAQIQEKLGNLEFPEILATTPSVYASKSGGGFGDSRINIRGFAQENIAVMINGVPVNDMENSKVYWSNWAGLSDVTSAMQVQRGLGSSKLAISSVGGTINVVTRSADAKQGGSVSVGTANDDYLKLQASYSTGKMKNGLSTSVLLSRTQGDGYVDGTKFEGHNYFIGVGYEVNEKHDFQFVFTGAPQWHHNRFGNVSIATALKPAYGAENGEPNVKYNPDWGYLNGKEYNMRRNYYHKPVMSLNWDFKLNETSKISTVVYGSWGRGGGSTATGGIKGQNWTSSTLKTTDGLVNFDLIQAWNSGETTTLGTRTQTAGAYQNSSSTGSATNLSTGITRVNSVNSHDWYGGIANFNTKLTEELTFDFGVDLRTYTGIHFTNISDLLGADRYFDNTDVNNPNRTITDTYTSTPSWNPFQKITDQTKISYSNDGKVSWMGAFTQLEYSKDQLSAFFQGAISQQGFKRLDYFKYLASNPLYETDYENIIGYNAKGGVNYNINDEMNVFVNAGYYSKQPFFNAVYPNNASIVNPNLTNEKIMSAEIGYGYKTNKFSANVNAYYTTWNDRFIIQNDATQVTVGGVTSTENPGGYFAFSQIKETHTGLELELNAKPVDKLVLNAMFSFADWSYNGTGVYNRYDFQGNLFGGVANANKTLYLDGVKVGDAAQFTASLGAKYEVIKNINIDADYRFVDKLYAAVSPDTYKSQNNKGALQLPNYSLLDAGISYKMLLGKDDKKSLNFRLNVNNVLDEIYIAESRTNVFANDNISSSNPALGTYQSNNRTWNGVADTNNVYFGFGRTWNLTMRYNF